MTWLTQPDMCHSNEWLIRRRKFKKMQFASIQYLTFTLPPSYCTYTSQTFSFYLKEKKNQQLAKGGKEIWYLVSIGIFWWVTKSTGKWNPNLPARFTGNSRVLILPLTRIFQRPWISDLSLLPHFLPLYKDGKSDLPYMATVRIN